MTWLLPLRRWHHVNVLVCWRVKVRPASVHEEQLRWSGGAARTKRLPVSFCVRLGHQHGA
eukprot:6112705-Prorocentrum_lima.AAC.1